MTDRKHPLLYEQDGDLNPTWIMVIAYAFIGLVACIVAIVLGKPATVIAALSFLGSMITVFLISALPKDKAKILSKARIQMAQQLGDVGSFRPFGSSTMEFDVDDYRRPDPVA